MKLKYCKNCLFPETKPDLFFNQDGVCSACLSSKEKYTGIDWEERGKAFMNLVEEHKLKNNEIGYDCLIPVSGGKDST
jgi:hypothetical protein